MEITQLVLWRSALMGEAERLGRDPRVQTDPEAQRRLMRVEFEIELLEERIRETAGSSE